MLNSSSTKALCSFCKQSAEGCPLCGIHSCNTFNDIPCHECDNMKHEFPELAKWVVRVLTNHLKKDHELDGTEPAWLSNWIYS